MADNIYRIPTDTPDTPTPTPGSNTDASEYANNASDNSDSIAVSFTSALIAQAVQEELDGKIEVPVDPDEAALASVNGFIAVRQQHLCENESPTLPESDSDASTDSSTDNISATADSAISTDDKPVSDTDPASGTEYTPEYAPIDDDEIEAMIAGGVEAFDDIPSDWVPDDSAYIPDTDTTNTDTDNNAKPQHSVYTAQTPSPVPLADRQHDPLLFVHLADLHLAPRSGTITKRDPETGRLIRDLDMTYALRRAIDDVLSQDPLPSACVIAGDIFDTFSGSQDAVIDAAREFKRLRDADIEIVAIAGNHDTPTQKLKTPAYVVLRHEFEDIAEDTGAHFAYDDIEHVRVGDVEYVLLPHNAASAGGFTEEDFARKTDAPKAVLVVHGVAAGDPSLAQMDEMKEIPIARWIMDMDWDYIAFGHYHKPGWIPGYKGRAAYCGSLENTVISGPDVCHRRGPVYIDMSRTGVDKLVMHPQKIRKIMILPDIDLAGRDVNAEELDREISELIMAADTDGCIVLHTIKNIPRSVVKTMTRRAFQAVNPDMLFIKTKIEYLTEMPRAVNLNDDGGSSESAGEDGAAAPETDMDENGISIEMEIGTDRNFKPLTVEVSEALERLIRSGEIRESRRVNVQKILDDVLEKC